ncbi:DUF2062 domain-containing protein [Paracoccus sp. TK19116]|uniref:DUF2062 domain-containing protein n=1 Tax=Paracoccus albicereus TaxID=2922394 RepID=A0ABT1MRW6_9RHOB|nr:DUF2062 domain-containing protein [Paracoccus albicereus]MCQ0970083.1 DUF2062 domain-containing protein [Paracoccus albicereus]
MVFKRRKPRSYGQIATELIYPRGGWRRAGAYVWHRVSRLPDQPHRIGRGVAAGVFVSFTPIFGFHFLGGAAVAWLIRGNILAALLATFVGNPVTIPFIAVGSLTLGHWLLGIDGAIRPGQIFREFERAFGELWHNVQAIFGPAEAHWGHLSDFARHTMLPYAIGGTILGVAAGMLAHYLTVPVIRAYHAQRARRMAKRIERLRNLPVTSAETPAPPPPRTHRGSDDQ